MKKKFLSMLLICSLLAVMLSACGSDDSEDAEASSSESADSDELIEITMYGSPDAQISAAQTIALLNGYYEEEGLDVTLTYIDNSAELGPMLGSGDIDIAFANSYATITWAAAGIDMKILTTNCDMSGTQAAAINKDITITSAEDLEGLTVGLVTNTEISIAMRIMCEEAGIDYDSFEIVPLSGGSELLAALDAGTIDIMAAWEPWVTNAENLGHSFLMSATYSEIPGLEGDKDWLHIYSVMLVSSSFAEENPDICAKIMSACYKATEFINDNRDEAVALLSEQFDIEEEDLANMMSRNVYDYGVYDEFVESTEWLEDYLYENGIIEAEVDFENYTDFSILEEAVPDAYTLTE